MTDPFSELLTRPPPNSQGEIGTLIFDQEKKEYLIDTGDSINLRFLPFEWDFKSDLGFDVEFQRRAWLSDGVEVAQIIRIRPYATRLVEPRGRSR